MRPNSELTICDVCDELIRVFSDKMNFKLVLVNDGSSDNSGQLCEQLCRKYPSTVTYVELSRNFGEHNAVMAGLNFARGDSVVIMDDSTSCGRVEVNRRPLPWPDRCDTPSP